MDDARWELTKNLFASALALPHGDRAAFLNRECAGDAILKHEVESLLDARTVSLVKLGVATGGGARVALAEIPTLEQLPISEAVGTIIGPYKLLQNIGEGGFGTVFMAEQRTPVARKVALKIIKLGMDTKAVAARFDAERQALAMMDHPHIARVFDGGITPITETGGGRPYFVMEYVRGTPITPFVREHRLSIGARLDLFMQVCLAVQHAHTKGIIHRDLKPANVLVSMVDGKPFAKVIDFGIAKSLAARLTEQTLFTEHRMFIGTPEYMSPEQAEGSPDIDTRADIYGLGVLLYELLTGLTPFDGTRLRSAAYQEMQRIIKEEDPPKPSLRVTQGVLRTPMQRVEFSDSGGTASDESALRPDSSPADPAAKQTSLALSRRLQGELDWIVMKALDKDRTRRYETASAFADDIGRHLAGEPVIAAPPSAGYRLRKFVRKHRGPVIAGSAIAAVLVVSIGAIVAFALETRRQASIAQANAVEARQQAGYALDAAEFIACANIVNEARAIRSYKPLTSGAVRHMRRIMAAESNRDGIAIVELVMDGGDADASLALIASPESGLNALTSLGLANSMVSDAGIAAIADKNSGLRALASLDLYNSTITDAGIAAIASPHSGLKAITSLDLSNTTITDAGVALLAARDTGVKALTSLSLNSSKITDAAIAALAAKDSGLKSLTSLNLNRSGITDAGIALLAARDSVLKTLKSLSLSNSTMSEAGIAALAAPDSGLQSLTSLCLANSTINDAGIASLAAPNTGLKAITSLDLSFCTITDAGIASLAAPDTGLTALASLSLSNSTITDAGLTAIAAKESGLKNLTSLSLSNLPISNAGIAALADKDSGLKALAFLDLSNSTITDSGVAVLAGKDSGLKAVTSLDLSNSTITDAGIAALADKDSGLKALTSLNLKGTELSAAGIASLKLARPNLRISR